MTDDQEKGSDRLTHVVRRVLQAGLTVAASLIVLGGLLAVAKPPAQDPRDSGMFSRAMQGDSSAVLELGLVVLMLTPVARVLVLAIGWLVSRDWTFSLVAFCVLALLVLSVLLGTG
jgi:Protein of unknown function (DUF1634)